MRVSSEQPALMFERVFTAAAEPLGLTEPPLDYGVMYEQFLFTYLLDHPDYLVPLHQPTTRVFCALLGVEYDGRKVTEGMLADSFLFTLGAFPKHLSTIYARLGYDETAMRSQVYEHIRTLYLRSKNEQYKTQRVVIAEHVPLFVECSSATIAFSFSTKV